MGFYPIFVEMQGRRVILVGGGHVALEKIGKLVDADADVTVVAPELIPPVREFTDADRARLIERPYEPGDIDGFDVVMIATDDGEVNRGIADEAREAQKREGELSPELLAVVRRGDYQRAKEQLVAALKIDQPLLARVG